MNSTPRIATAAALMLLGAGVFVFAPGCITNHRYNAAATQPATVIDPATTQPWYYMCKMPACQVDAGNFEAMVLACERVARQYQFNLDREDYRAGIISTEPMISKQFIELWRKDAGTIGDVERNSLQTIRRTLYFEIQRLDLGQYRMTPKVLVEQETVLERRVTSVTQYRGIFSGPADRPTEAADVKLDIPTSYWTPIARDSAMEVQVGKAVEKELAKIKRQAGAD